MSEPIVTREYVERRARRDFEHGVTECPFPWHSEARKTWLEVQAELIAQQREAPCC